MDINPPRRHSCSGTTNGNGMLEVRIESDYIPVLDWIKVGSEDGIHVYDVELGFLTEKELLGGCPVIRDVLYGQNIT